MDVKKNLGQDGQALVEFLLFLPFMLMMYSVTLTIGNAINASINQQKITRSYFFYRVQNNSNIPKPDRVQNTTDNWQTFGMQITGWMARLDGSRPVSACYRFRVPLGEGTNDECEEGYSGESTQYIRVGTVYGMCGATYANGNGGVIRLPGAHAKSDLPFAFQGCLLQ